MPTTCLSRKYRLINADVEKLKPVREKIPTKHQSPSSDAVYGLEELDKETLLSLSLDAPTRLTPPPGNNALTSESSPTPLSKKQVSSDVMEATLD
jgi:hypothetical protein